MWYNSSSGILLLSHYINCLSTLRFDKKQHKNSQTYNQHLCFNRKEKVIYYFLIFSYRESSARISRSIKLRPRTAIEESADWIVYTQALGGLAHLRPRGLDLPFYQLYLLDVLAVFVLLLMGVFAVVYLVIRCFYRMCFNPKPNKEKPH